MVEALGNGPDVGDRLPSKLRIRQTSNQVFGCPVYSFNPLKSLAEFRLKIQTGIQWLHDSHNTSEGQLSFRKEDA
jgi:hypothetical protein